MHGMFRASLVTRKPWQCPAAVQALLVLGTGLGLSAPAAAIGFGHPQTLSALGQPLHMLLPLRLSPGESVAPDCVSVEILAGEVRIPTALLTLRLEGRSESSVHALRLQSQVRIDEPVVTVSLSLGCQLRLQRQFTALIDPPSSQADQGLSVALPEPELVRGYSPAMQAALATAQADPERLLDRLESSVVPPPVRALAASAVPPSAQPASLAPQAAKDRVQKKRRKPLTSKAPTASASATPAPRLQLEAPDASLLAAAASAAVAASMPASSAASAPGSADTQRLSSLEQAIGKLQAEQRASLLELQALREQLARQQNDAGRSQAWLYLLGLVSLLSLALAGWLWRDRRRQAPVDWWGGVEPARVAQPPAPAAAPAPSRDPVVAPPALAAVNQAVKPLVGSPSSEPLTSPAELPHSPPMALPPGTAAPAQDLTLTVAAAPAPFAAGTSKAEVPSEPVSFQFVESALAASAPPALSVEDLIDLEQQVDFFVVLGQDDAAIELLRRRLDGSAAASPLPWLKLLQLYQRGGQRDEFDLLARRFVAVFDYPAPAWSEAAMAPPGEGLAGHASLLARLQASWRDSAATMALLQALLVAPRPGAEPLELATLADLLMLYGVARDLSEQEVRGDAIDVFLPLDAKKRSAVEPAAAEMMATMRWQTPPGAASRPKAAAIEVDISLDDPGPAGPP